MKTLQNEKTVDLRLVDVIARYEEKRNGRPTGVVFYMVRPSEKTLEREPDTDPYRVVFFDGRLQHCTCKGYREWSHCFHGDELQKREQSRVTSQELPGLHNSTPLNIINGIPMR